MDCIYCGKRMAEGGTSCYSCGKIQSIRCSCGQELPRSARFCMACGQPVSSEQAQPVVEVLDESYLEKDLSLCPRRQECYGGSLLSPSFVTGYQGHLYYLMNGGIYRSEEHPPDGTEPLRLFDCPTELSLARLDVNGSGIYLVPQRETPVGIYRYDLEGTFFSKKDSLPHGLMLSSYLYGTNLTYVSRELRALPESPLSLAEREALHYGETEEVIDRLYLFDFDTGMEKIAPLDEWSGQYTLVYGGATRAVVEMTFEAEDEEDYFMESAVGYYAIDFETGGWTCLSHQRLFPHLLHRDLPLYRKIYQEDYERGQTISFFHGGLEVFWTHNYKEDVLEPRKVESPFQIYTPLPLWRWNPEELFRRDVSYFDGKYFFMNPSMGAFVSVDLTGESVGFGEKSTTAQGFLLLGDLLYLKERDGRLWQYTLSYPKEREAQESAKEEGTGILVATGKIFGKDFPDTYL